MTNTFAHVQLAEILEAYDLNRQGLGQHPFAKAGPSSSSVKSGSARRTTEPIIEFDAVDASLAALINGPAQELNPASTLLSQSEAAQAGLAAIAAILSEDQPDLSQAEFTVADLDTKRGAEVLDDYWEPDAKRLRTGDRDYDSPDDSAATGPPLGEAGSVPVSPGLSHDLGDDGIQTNRDLPEPDNNSANNGKLQPATEGGAGEQRGGQYMEYECGYCGQCKVSTSSSADGRVRIRCECGGKHRDNKARMHAKWIARPGQGGTQQELKSRMRAQWKQVTPGSADALVQQAYALNPAMQQLMTMGRIGTGIPVGNNGAMPGPMPGAGDVMPNGPNMSAFAMLAQLQAQMGGLPLLQGAPVSPLNMPFIEMEPGVAIKA